MNTMKKIDVAVVVIRQVLLDDNVKMGDVRKEFIKRFEQQIKEIFNEIPKKNLAPSYYQMIKYEVDQKSGGRYRHHKNQRSTVQEPIHIVNNEQEQIVDVNFWTGVDSEIEVVDNVQENVEVTNKKKGRNKKVA